MELMLSEPGLVETALLTGTSTALSPLLAWLMNLNTPVLRMLSPDHLASLLMWQFHIPHDARQSLRDDLKAFRADTLSQLVDAYRLIRVPSGSDIETLVLVGSRETIPAKSAARRIAKTIPGARGFYVKGAGHVWNLQLPDLFNRTLRDWIERRPMPDDLAPL